MDTIDRYNKAIAYFTTYKEKGGADERVEQYLKDAAKGIDREQRRREREKKDQLRKAQNEAARRRSRRRRLLRRTGLRPAAASRWRRGKARGGAGLRHDRRPTGANEQEEELSR
jgi:hypothetical protein